MITNIKSLEKYCTDYQNIQNYEDAVKSPLRYDLHHRREISEHKSKSDLIEENLYYYRPPEELVFLEHGEHMRLHNKGKHWHLSAETRQKMSEARKGNQCALGHHCSAETRAKLSEAKKGENNPNFGKHPSTETRQKLSAARKGRHWHLENAKRVYTD